VTINGTNYPSRPIRFDFDSDFILEGYRFLLDNLGIGVSDTELDITAAQYSKSYFILAFDLSAIGDNGYTPHTPQQGTISFTATLQKAPTHAITLMTHAVFENKLVIDKNHQVHLDYTT
jgi:hypothetical protein